MIRRWLITLIALPLALLVTGLLLYRSNVVPERQCSVLYREYKNVDGIRATFIRDFQVNDTLTVDVTMLSATTDAGWDRLKKDFAIQELPPEVLKTIEQTDNYVFSRIVPRHDPRQPLDTIDRDNNTVLSFDYKTRVVWFFDSDNGNENKDILYHIFPKTKLQFNHETYN